MKINCKWLNCRGSDHGHLYPHLQVPGLASPGRGSNPGLQRGRRALYERTIETAGLVDFYSIKPYLQGKLVSVVILNRNSREITEIYTKDDL